MVPPLDIEMMIVAQGIENYVGTGSPVENVSENMKGVDGQPLDEVAHRHDEFICPADIDDRTDDDVDIGLLVRIGAALVQEFLDYV